MDAPLSSYLMLTGAFPYAFSSGASGTKTCRGTVRMASSTREVRTEPLSTRRSMSWARRRSASLTSMVSLFTSPTVVVGDAVPGAGRDAVARSHDYLFRKC